MKGRAYEKKGDARAVIENNKKMTEVMKNTRESISNLAP
jgi:hypothetical protein